MNLGVNLPQDFLLYEVVNFPYCLYIGDYKLVALLSRILWEMDIQISTSR